MKQRSPRVLAAIPVVALIVATWAHDSAATRVSGPTPFARCTGPAAGGTVARNTEVEPYVAADPAQPGHLVAAWQQDHWSNDGAVGIDGATSRDYGRSWSRSELPFSRCVPGGLPYDRAYDSWVSIGPDATVYAAAIASNAGGAARGPSDAVAVSVFVDGGHSWRPPRIVAATTGAGHADKDSVTADPVRAGWAYVVWDAVAASGARGYFARTTDGGHTWSPPRPVAARVGGKAFNNVIVVDPRTDKLYDFYTLFAAGGAKLQVVSSTDTGTTWSAPVTVATADPAPLPGRRTGSYVTSTAIDPTSGRLYVAFGTGRFGAGNDIALTISGDGSTWSGPVRVSTGAPAFTPAVAVGAAGAVAVGYYDLGVTSPTSVPARYRLRISPAGGRRFGAPAVLAGPFNMLAAPVADGHFLGDYDGLAATGRSFVAVFAASNCAGRCPADPTGIYAARRTP